ncbi:MAG: T9SS type A sorting domain-containing protein, partial [Bacteroidota bacterium]
NEWGKNAYVDYSYDTPGNIIEEIRRFWDAEVNEWVYSRKSENFWSDLSDNITEDPGFMVAPNPFTDYTIVRFSEPVSSISIDLSDRNGRIVRTIDNVSGISVTIQRGNLPGGVYFIRVHTDEPGVQKVIIM